MTYGKPLRGFREQRHLRRAERRIVFLSVDNVAIYVHNVVASDENARFAASVDNVIVNVDNTIIKANDAIANVVEDAAIIHRSVANIE
ncbi:Hypothetical predicted protein [Octopus vulgaris]|uniref:Uncharacterized protein n=1 Tax=Octopus vulgaris TaxID=6645 RepID=A0AA36BR57_OCTVU|nr:Hypothetical predicted protein [Octopus vulgaris]